MRKNNKQVTTPFIICSLLLIGIVYAILQANLQINGIAKISSNTWNIYFDNIQVNTNSVPIGDNDSPATIDPENNCKVDFSVTLSLPGDFYEFTVDVKNSGTIDGMIGELTKTIKVNGESVSEVPDYLNYSVTYSDGIEIVENHALDAGTTETYLVRLEFKSDVEELPDATTISTSIEIRYIQADSGAIRVNHPLPIVLDDGMIPVIIANDGIVTAISKNDSTWYDYNNKIWANAVLTTETNRSTYQAIANGTGSSTIIPSNEILAYFVWIPRYSYKIWTLDASDVHTGEEQTIDIKFVDIDTRQTGTTIGSYYTHPAFTFGSEELPGFWVGKFESSADTSSTCYTSPSTANCNNANQSPRVVPNVDSMRFQSVSNEFSISLKFAGGTQSGSTVTFVGNTTYGLTSSADSHMMKNSEWGAVAYLSHSKYGINDEIRTNNFGQSSSPYRKLTGCGADIANSSSVTICDITYGSSSSYPQSTTGNISGVFDMSGGAWEYVMGNYDGTIGASEFSTLPDSKYYDIYPSSIFTGDSTTNMSFCSLTLCGGHALYETAKWYEEYFVFISSSNPWIGRGGRDNNSIDAGIFNSGANNGGSSNSHHTWRSVLVAR